jgi:hypothetical protein
MSKPKETVLSMEAVRLLSLLPDKLPALLYADQVGVILNISQESVKILAHAGRIKRLGRPSKSGRLVFASTEIMRLRKNPAWLHEAKACVSGFWHKKNRERDKGRHDGYTEL